MALLAKFTCLIVSFISVESLFFVCGRKFGLLCFWEMMTHVVTWRGSWKCKQPCCGWSV